MENDSTQSATEPTEPLYAASAALASAPPPLPPLTNAPLPDATGKAILLMCLISLIFSLQDGVSRVLGSAYPPLQVVMVRYWIFALFAIAMVSSQPGGLKRAMHSKRPVLQIIRGLLLVFETHMMVVSFVRLGLIESHAVFTVYPLIVAALSGPVLGEKVGWRRWTAIFIGFLGILVILRPGSDVMDPAALLSFGAAVMFALYGLLTRMVSRDDPSIVSFFWSGVAGAIGITFVGIWEWEWFAPVDWGWMALLSILGITSHYLLIRAYEMSEASALQPFAYTQLVWASLLGFLVFGDVLRPNVVLGAVIVVAAGLFTLWRQRVTSG